MVYCLQIIFHNLLGLACTNFSCSRDTHNLKLPLFRHGKDKGIVREQQANVILMTSGL